MEILQNQQKAYLLLADGTVFEGLSFGSKGTTIGEVVFTTGLTGYQETLTDPSYYGQIVMQTFPLIGNYGVNSEDIESASTYVRGYIVREWCEIPSNFRSENNINWYLERQRIIGIYDIDTRALTRRLREHGVMNGMITTENVYDNFNTRMDQVKSFQIRDAVARVTIPVKKPYASKTKAVYKVALLDYGYKRNILRSLLLRGCNVEVLPATTSPSAIRDGGYDGIMLPNGPGDPAENKEVIANLAKIIKLGLPIFGICLGHQLAALAMGGKTAKLKYGHRGANQPVIALDSGKTYVTSQNHGYEVVGDSVPKEVGEVSHINANDNSCEGIRYHSGKMFTVQFHPEASGGPADTSYLFDQFVDMMKSHREGK